MARYETAPYRVLESDENFELRSYDGYYTAAIDSRQWQGSNGFSQIFEYISGANESGEKISMTTPVLNELEEGAATTEFVMPQKYDGPSLPRPQNPSIRIKANQAHLAAAIRFSGTVNQEKLEEMEKKLRLWIRGKGLEATGTPRLARYNPPFIPPFFRRNELLLDVIRKVSQQIE